LLLLIAGYTIIHCCLLNSCCYCHCYYCC
jgi:hypothetical protein